MSTNLIEISKKDEEIIRCSAFLAKLRGDDSACQKNIEDLYKQAPSNIANALSYAMFNWFRTRNDKAIRDYDMEASLVVMKGILDAVESILSIQPGYWLARFIKARLLLLSVNTEEQILEDLNFLLKLQEQNEYRPYFIITHLLMSETYFSMADRERAIHYLELAEALPQKEVDIVPDFLFVSVKEYRNKLKRSGESEMAARVHALMKTFFGID